MSAAKDLITKKQQYFEIIDILWKNVYSHFIYIRNIKLNMNKRFMWNTFKSEIQCIGNMALDF